MMINKMVKGIMIFLIPFLSQAQKKIVSDFNLDKIKDTLTYNCDDKTNAAGQPNCMIDIIMGKSKKKYMFNLEYISYPIISDCGSGCISFYDGSKDTEYTQEYNYSKKYDDWILTIDETRYNYENGRVENNLPKKYLLGITGKKYSKK